MKKKGLPIIKTAEEAKQPFQAMKQKGLPVIKTVEKAKQALQADGHLNRWWEGLCALGLDEAQLLMRPPPASAL